jgi:hypothetical protein
MNATVATTRAKKPAQRLVNVGKPCNGVYAMRLSVNGQTTGFSLRPIASDFGRSFQLTKFDGDTGTDADARSYCPNLDGERSSLCCAADQKT